MYVDNLNSATGGYQLKIFKNVSDIEKYKCMLCRNVLKDAIQLPQLNCPGRACVKCYTENIRNGLCPISEVYNATYYPDKFADREIGELKVYCVNRENGCLWSNSLKLLEEHMSSCVYQISECSLYSKAILRKNKEEFDSPDGSATHEALLVSEIKELKQDLAITKINTEKKDIKIQQLESYSLGMCKQIDGCLKDIDELRNQLKSMCDLVESMQNKITMQKEQPSEPLFPILGGGAKLKKDVSKLTDKVCGLEHKNEEFHKSVTGLDLKIQLIENKTMQGELIWKIDKIDFRIAQAKLGKVTALHSAPCYTKQYEYKYCSRLYLNGDGMGRSTHISIFFVVMKSEYDELLTWPMQKRITFELINLEDAADSVIETFVSNLKSSTFLRPTKNMNVATGCPTFISIERFLKGGFVKDDCAYIRTSVTDV